MKTEYRYKIVVYHKAYGHTAFHCGSCEELTTLKELDTDGVVEVSIMCDSCWDVTINMETWQDMIW